MSTSPLLRPAFSTSILRVPPTDAVLASVANTPALRLTSVARTACRLASATTLAFLLAACHQDVKVGEGESAGDPDAALSASGADAPDEPDFDPLDHCTSKPDEDFEGSTYRCEGDLSSTIVFDYYGDPDLGLENLLVCVDWSNFKAVEPGYVLTCMAQTLDLPFGTEGIDVDTCCLEGAPEEAILPLCRIDAAEEICRSSADNLNTLRKQIPLTPKFAETNQQLLNLNLHIAKAITQTDCASTFAKGFVDVGDIDGYTETIDWSPGNNDNPDTGWPWIRNIELNVVSFHIDDTIDSGSACGVKMLTSTLEGSVAPVKLTLDGPLGAGTSGATSGRFSLATEECVTGACSAELRALDLEVPSFSVGAIRLSGLHIQLTTPVRGRMHGTTLRFPARDLEFLAQGSAQAPAGVLVGGLDIGAFLDGRQKRVLLRASGDLLAEIDSDELVITDLWIDSWPVTAQVKAERR